MGIAITAGSSHLFTLAGNDRPANSYSAILHETLADKVCFAQQSGTCAVVINRHDCFALEGASCVTLRLTAKASYNRGYASTCR